MDSARKSITVKIDHNLSQQHRLSGTYSYEKAAPMVRMSLHGRRAPGYGGYLLRKPQTFTASLTSTLKPTLLNEFRFGLAYNMNRTMTPLNNPATGKIGAGNAGAHSDRRVAEHWTGLPVLVAPGSGIS